MTPEGTGAFIFGCAGPVLTPEEAAFFRDARPWGFILFAKNVETSLQIKRLTHDLREAVGWNSPILIDQEGGRVQRLRGPEWREWHPPLEQAMIGDRDRAARAMTLRARLIAHELHALGIDVNCVPTADVATPKTHPFLRNRTFGEDIQTVIALAKATVAGHLQGGVLPVLKHIPGHGRAVADSHLDLPQVDVPLETLRATDFAPFAALNDVALGMTAHVVYGAIDPDAPGTISPLVHHEIRQTIGFDGLLMTDDLSMNALPGDIATRTRASLAAGCDLVLHCNGDRAEMEAVAAHAHALSARARDRSERALAQRQSPAPLDIAAVEADLETLLNGQVYDTTASH